MAYSSFMKFAETITKGESQDKKYNGSEGWFEIYSFSWGASNPTSIQSGKGAASGRVSISSFNIMKKFDIASTELFQQCCLGKHFTKADVVLSKAGGDEVPLEFINFAFEEVFVESIQWSGSAGGDDTPTESVSFAFGKVTITYKEQAATGSGDASPVGSWDLRLNAK
jgi:type VI secretion system secreted protein Hcp